MHPARTIPYADLVAGLEAARGRGLVSRKTCPDTGLHIYCYTQRCVYDDAWDAFSLVARGLVLDPVAQAVVATPFPKFFNLGERRGVAPDLPFEAFDKLDGSLIIVFHYAGRWRTATKGAFVSRQAAWAQARLDARDTSALMPGTTYLFEAIYPENVIVIRYTTTGLVLLGAYDDTGREIDWSKLLKVGEATGFPVSWRHPFQSISELVRIAGDMPSTLEGFVVRFSDGTRLKIKGAEYKRIHALISRCTPLAVWDVMNAGLPLDDMRRDLPEEFWEDFDAIVAIFKARALALASRIQAAAKAVQHLSDRDLGRSLGFQPDDVRPFLFAYRKAGGRLEGKVYTSLMRAIRPNGNVLDGYVPSYAMGRLMDEAA